jgi:hypothetical protein
MTEVTHARGVCSSTGGQLLGSSGAGDIGIHGLPVEVTGL